MKKANGIKILSALLMAMTTLCGCAGGTNDSSSSSSATMSSEESSSNVTSASSNYLSSLSSATTSSEESSSTDNSSSNDPYLEELNITYTLDEENHTYIVTGVKDKQAEDIDLPRELTIDNVIYVLVRIGDSAFSNCSSLTSITIPDSVTSIGKDAFFGCNSLESLTLPFIDTYLGYYFGATTLDENYEEYVPESLKTIIILGGTSIPDYAFAVFSSLISINIPSSVTSIGEGAFSGCSSLKNITIPSSATSIGDYAFYGCSSLKNITIPSSVTSIGEDAFWGCSSLTIYCEPSIEPEGWYDVWNADRPVYWGINENTFIEKDGIQYVVIDEKAVVTKYVGISTNVEIPATIEINGKIYNVARIEEKAFYKCSSLKNIAIRNNTTSIGNYAFEDCTQLQSVAFDSNSELESIGNFAFSNCNSLTTITIPDSVTSIGNSAFYECNSLTTITIPSSVTSIGNYAFDGCSFLKSITIPNSVTSIGEFAFYGCDSIVIYCEASSKPSGWNGVWNCYNVYYASRPVYWGINENTFIEKDGIQYVIRNEERAVVTGYVGTSTKVEIPATIEINGTTYDVTSIYDFAFSYCSALTSITIPSSVTYIGDMAFTHCISSSITIPSSVTYIGEYAFEGCTSLIIYCEASSKPSEWETKWNLYNGGTVYWGINENNFIEKNGIQYVIIDKKAVVTRYVGTSTKVEIPATIEINGKTYNVASIGVWAFRGCSFLTNITIPDSVTSIGENAFYGCSSLERVDYDGTISKWASIAFDNSFANPLSIMKKLYIDGKLFQEENIVLEGIEKIGTYAFAGCDFIKTVTIPSSVTSIGGFAFYNCSSLTSITIPNSVTIIGRDAFYGCSSLESVTIPSSVTYIGGYAFSGCSSLTIYCEVSSKPSGWDYYWNHYYYDDYSLDRSRPVYWEINENNFIEKDGIQYVISYEEALVTGYVGTSTNVEIPATIEINGNIYDVTSIEESAFSSCSSLISITIPNSVTYIGSWAFDGCDSLESITIPSSVTYIGSWAFYECSSLESVTIPDSVTSIGGYAFYECSSLTYLTIPSSVTYIGGYAFSNCDSLTIYCEASSKPTGWNDNWNSSDRPVYWEDEWHYENGVPTLNN